MNHKLSIIIPCYNCTATLEEAVASVYAQNLNTPFEIVMVDDKSTDETVALMKKLSNVHPEIKLFYHTHNQGGGATRNSGIKHSQGDLIFCLDSDNLLFPNTMQKMIEYLIHKNCDGVAIHERRYFKENDQTHYSAHYNKISNEPITFENLFDDTSALLDNFLFTKEAYNKTQGYPEKHGFDTQCFEIRFLSAGNTVYVCPDTIFLHRQAILSKGYFHRVYEEGLFSINFYLIFEEILCLFSQDSIKNIIQYDIFSQNKLGKNNIKAFFSESYKQIGRGIFRHDFKKYLVQDGYLKYNRNLDVPKGAEDKFIKAVFLFREKKYQDAHVLYLEIAKEYPDSKVIIYNIARCETALAGTMESQIESEAIKKSSCKPIPRKMELDANRFKILLVRIKNFLFMNK